MHQLTGMQSLFTPYYTRFLVSADDLRVVKLTKIQLLLHLLTPETYSSILREFIVSNAVVCCPTTTQLLLSGLRR